MRLLKNKVSFFSLIFFVFFVVFLFAMCPIEITPQKRIGKTEFYLVKTMAQSSDGKTLPQIFRLEEDGECFVGVDLEGFPKHIYWNNDYILVKCTDGDKKGIITYCIIKLLGKYDFIEERDVRVFHNKNEYEAAKYQLHLDESKMDYTDDTIPWSLHLFD